MSKDVSFAVSPKKIVNGNATKKMLFRRGKSLLGPLPDCSFGPKAVSRRPDVTRDYAFDPDNHRLTWTKPPESILIVKRTGRETDSAFKTVSSWLVQEKKMVVYVEAKILSSEHMQQDDEFGSVFAQLKPYHKKNDITYKSNVDLIITIGGDGTLLYAASMFQHSMPPVIALSMGSLGFLTAHPLETYKSTIDSVIAGNATLMLRGRMRCKIEK